MELLRIDCLGKELRLEGSMAGWQQLFWGDTIVAGKNASEDNQGPFSHEFQLTQQKPGDSEPTSTTIRLEIDLTWQPFLINYRLLHEQQVLTEGSRNTKDIEQQVPVKPIVEQRKISMIGLASLGFKLLKSAKVIKVV